MSSRRRLRWLALGAALLATVLLSVGCGSSSDGGGGAATGATPSTSAEVPALPTVAAQTGATSFTPVAAGSGKGLKIGYISLAESAPFIHIVSEGIKAQAKRAGVELVFCDAQNNAAKALDCAKTMVTAKVQGLINYQADAKAAAKICDAGPQVPVIGLFIHQAPCEDSWLGADDSYAGEIAGQAVGNYFKKKFDCKYDGYVSLQAYETGQLNTDRMNGYNKGFASVCGPIRNEKKIQASRVDEARTAFADVLTALPGAKHVVVVGVDDDGILGALAAAKTQGRLKDLYVSGQGADPSAWCDIKSNPQWIGDSAYFPEKLGQSAIANMIKLINKQSVPKELFIPHTVVNTQNLEKYYQPSGC